MDRWLTLERRSGGVAYPLTPYGLITYFNDKIRYEGVRVVVEKAAAG